MAAFMKLGDIRGESVVAPDVADQDWLVVDNGDQVAQFKPGDVRDHNHGNRTNWDVICDLGTAIKQTSVADALTDYRLTGIETGSGDDHIIQYVTGDGSDNLQLETGLGEAGVECKVPPSLLKPQEGLDSRLINHDDFLLVNNVGGVPQGPGGTSYLTGYAEAVGLDSSTVDAVNKLISSLQPANEFI